MRDLLFAFQKSRFAVLGAIALLVVAGIASLLGLPVEAVPDISPRQVLVSVIAPGLATEEVEQLITFPVESSMAGLPDLTDLRSVSRSGVSVVYVQFADESDINLDRARVQERIQQARSLITVPGVSVTMGPLATGLGEIMQFEIKGAGYSPMALNRLMTWTVAPQLKLVPGVVDVNINGGAEETYALTIDPARLLALGVSLGEVYRQVDANNADSGGGWIEHHQEQQIVVGRGLIGSLADFGAIPVRVNADGSAIYLRDLGKISLGARTRLGAVTRDGRGEVVVGVVLMRLGASSNAALAAIDQALPGIRQTLPKGVTLEPYYRRSTLTGRTIDTVKENLLSGAALVLAVLIVVIGDWRASLVIASVIPFSLICTMMGMRWLGISANLLSLGAIDFGMIVDGSLVVIEHLMTRRSELAAGQLADGANAGGRPDGAAMAETPVATAQGTGGQGADSQLAGAVPQDGVAHTTTSGVALVVEAASEVVRPVAFAILIIVMVYLPILTLQGIEGKMFRPMAQTVIMALLASLAYGLVGIPVLAMLFLKRGAHHGETRLVAALRRRYVPLLAWCRDRSTLVFCLTGAIFLVSLVLASRLGGEFIPTVAEGALTVTTTRLPSISLPQTLKEVTQQEQILKRFPEVLSVVTTTGTAAIPTDPMGVNESDSFIFLREPSEWTTARTQEGLVEAMSKALTDAMPGTQQSWSQPVEMRMDDLLSGVRTQIAVSIYGHDLDVLARLGGRVAAAISAVPGAADVAAQGEGNMAYIHVDIDRVRAARRGVAMQDVLDTVEAVGGHIGRPVTVNDAMIATQIRFDPMAVADIVRIARLRVRRTDGRGAVPLSEIARVSVADGPPRISRDQIQRRMIVQANVRGRDLSSFVAAAQRAVAAKVPLPQGYRITWAGQFRNLQSAMARLEIVVPVALVLIFGLLCLALNSPLAALLVFVNLPIAATGGIFALVLRGLPFSISAGIGFIALFGVAILNGVVLVSTIQLRCRNGMSPETAAFEAAFDRFRPVMATALVASLGFIPMALSTSAGAEVERPLATVVIGGLISSTMLTLLVLPSLYARVMGRRKQ